MARVKASMDPRFADAVAQGLNKLAAAVQEHEERFESVVERLGSMERRLKALETTLGSLFNMPRSRP